MSPQYTTPPVDRWNSHQQDTKRPKLLWIAFLIAILIHIGLFLVFKKISIQHQANSFEDLETEIVYMDQVIIETDEVSPTEHSITVPEESELKEAIPELDALAKLKNQDIEIKPTIIEPEFSIKMSTPLAMGSETSQMDEILNSDLNISTLDTIGSPPLEMPLVDSGQIILEGGSLNKELPSTPTLFGLDQLKGTEGQAIKGVLDGYSTVDDLLSMSDISLSGAKAALPSDLLYSYDSAKLKESAKYGLMKLALLINRNPKMYCILEGHSDLFGADEYNLDLSRARAQAVKDYLVESLRQKSDRIIVRGFGNSQPILAEGSIEEQSVNRRVDILMRSEIDAGPPKPILVKPTKTPELNMP